MADDLVTEYIADEIVVYDKQTHLAHCTSAEDWDNHLLNGLTRRQTLVALIAAGAMTTVAVPPPAAAQSLPTLCVSNCGDCHQRGMACCHTTTFASTTGLLRKKLKLCVPTCADCTDTVLQAANCGTTATNCS